MKSLATISNIIKIYKRHLQSIDEYDCTWMKIWSSQIQFLQVLHQIPLQVSISLLQQHDFSPDKPRQLSSCNNQYPYGDSSTQLELVYYVYQGIMIEMIKAPSSNTLLCSHIFVATLLKPLYVQAKSLMFLLQKYPQYVHLTKDIQKLWFSI